MSYYNDNTPDVDFDVDESYSGILPISTSPEETRKLFFWGFPSSSGDTSTDDLVIWLNSGPGCSSLEGLLQENGLLRREHGMFGSPPNDYAWNQLASMLWVEQPVCTGCSQGEPNITAESGVVEQFLGSLDNWLASFGMQGLRTLVTGESYAGFYVPYIVNAIYRLNNTALFNPTPMIHYPSVDRDMVLQQIPVVPFVEAFTPVFALNSSFMSYIQHSCCNYPSSLEQNLVFLPPGLLPNHPHTTPECDLWTQIFATELLVSLCFNVYPTTTRFPLLWDARGFPGSFDYVPPGESIYFNRSGVQSAIHAPPRAERFWVPFGHRGDAGVVHEERGLTWVTVEGSGHIVPEAELETAL